MRIYNKIKWTLGISVVFLLILATNLIDKNNFTRIKDSVVTIYEDRLVAKDIIFELLIITQEKEMANVVVDPTFFVQRNLVANQRIDELIDQYLTTKLTTDEKRFFDKLQTDLRQLQQLENTTPISLFDSNKKYQKQIEVIKANLIVLSKIQMAEGKKHALMSKATIKTVELFTQIEIYMLIFLAILIQIVVIYKPKYP